MPGTLKEFGDIAKKLSANPLGIIALFIVLVYGIAALVLGVSANNLDSSERLPLIWFLVIFPPIVLFTFAWLVAKHHPKLYAPKDYPDSTQFFKTLNINQQREKLQSEIQSLEGKTAETETTQSPSSPKSHGWDLMSRVLLAEELALRRLSADFSVDIRRQVDLGGGVAVDGMFIKHREGFVVEVKFCRHPKNVQDIVASVRRIQNYIYYHLGWRKFNLILVAVIDDTNTQNFARVKEVLEDAASELDRIIEIRSFRFSELVQEYRA